MAKFRIAILALLVGTAPAGARESTLEMSCTQARALIANQGAAVLTTGRHTYERFVAHGGYCMIEEYAEQGYAPTRDGRQCPVGFVCRTGPRLFEDD
jgi:hypothetical protein